MFLIFHLSSKQIVNSNKDTISIVIKQGRDTQWFKALAALVGDADSISSTHDGSQPYATSVPEDPILSTNLCRHQACGAHTYIHVHTCRQNIKPIK